MKMAFPVNIFNQFPKDIEKHYKILYYSDMATRYMLCASKQTTSKCVMLVLSNHLGNTIEPRTVRVR